jgi:hypothetical protein
VNLILKTVSLHIDLQQGWIDFFFRELTGVLGTGLDPRLATGLEPRLKPVSVQTRDTGKGGESSLRLTLTELPFLDLFHSFWSCTVKKMSIKV